MAEKIMSGQKLSIALSFFGFFSFFFLLNSVVQIKDYHFESAKQSFRLEGLGVYILADKSRIYFSYFHANPHIVTPQPNCILTSLNSQNFKVWPMYLILNVISALEGSL